MLRGADIKIKETFLPVETFLFVPLIGKHNKMKVSDLVKNKINRLPEGYVFTYDDFTGEVKNESALKLALFKLVKSSKIERLSKGRFYKPKQGLTGKLYPDEYEVVKDLLKSDNKVIGYLTGLGIFNRLGLTTQMSNVIQIGSNFDKKQIKRGKYNIKYIRQWNKITAENINLLQLLDCIRFIKNIPDTSPDQSFKRLVYLVEELQKTDVKIFTSLALNYPPSTRALAGAILEKLNFDDLSAKLLNSLNPTTHFKLDISTNQIPNKLKWKIL